MAAPICLKLRWPDSFAHCIETSHAGVEVLRRFGFTATITLCAVFIDSPETDEMCWIAHTRESAYALLQREKFAGLPSFDEFRSERALMEPGIHMAIRASHAGETAFLDLTLGQINAKTKRPLTPVSLALFNKEWPDGSFDKFRSTIIYSPHPDPESIDAVHLDPKEVLSGPEDGFVADLMDVTRLALRVECNVDRFAEAVAKHLYICSYPDDLPGRTLG